MQPILLSGLNCTKLSRTDTEELERLQRKFLKWASGNYTHDYAEALHAFLTFFQCPFLQMRDLLWLSKLVEEQKDHTINILELQKNGRNSSHRGN